MTGPKIILIITISAVLLINSGCRNNLNDKLLAASAPPLQKARGGHAAGLVNGEIIIAGGTLWSDDRSTKTWLDDCEIYNANNKQTLPPLPHPIAYCAYAANKSGLYIAGGSDGKNTLDRAYHLSKSDGFQWRRLPNLPAKTTFTAGAMLNNEFFTACGSDGISAVNTLYKLPLGKPDSLWQQCQSLPGPARMLPAFTACGKYLYLFGGFSTEPGKPLTAYSDVYRYDPRKNHWKRLNDFPVNGYGWNAVPIDNRHILISGRADGKVIHKDIWIYDTASQSAFLADEQTSIQTTTAPLVKTADNRYLLLGGEPDALKTRTDIVTQITISQ